MSDVRIEPGGVWRAKRSTSLMQTIRIISETDRREVWLVEWVANGRHVNMTAESIRDGYTQLSAPS